MKGDFGIRRTNYNSNLRNVAKDILIKQ
jgi:hypothetical protein